ncbi:MAG: hypothetical protein ED859_11605 [Desulfuromonadales bacterium]|nr:MAG: hypothetical protein ED859_11605 [Desulfuromonadales bacterium]
MRTWIGRKKLAFLPVHRLNAQPPDEPVPADWPSEILRRVLFDPTPPTGADRSLRAYIQAASSGQADLDAVVLPMQVIDRQDVPPNAFEAQFGAQLREQGFDAAALVMLGGPGAGTAESVGGFWARFVMAEGLGVWAMELIHCLASIDDLYTFGGNMGGFEEMAGALGTHPSAYTKSIAGWLDVSAITRHTNHTAAVTYNLHAIGLVQPPPTGRVGAVRIGSQVPYLMVEARLMNDQFDAQIPAPGVIVYRVQTSSPQGTAQNQTMPLQLLTLKSDGKPTALNVGQSFTAGDLKVKVVKALSGGFSISVDDSLKAIGFVTSYESERVDPDRPPGPSNPVIQTIEIDSKPGFIFTATGGPSFAATVKNAQKNHRKVEITFTSTGPNSGKIVSVKLK